MLQSTAAVLCVRGKMCVKDVKHKPESHAALVLWADL